jgi:hypothetical protein
VAVAQEAPEAENAAPATKKVRYALTHDASAQPLQLMCIACAQARTTAPPEAAARSGGAGGDALGGCATTAGKGPGVGGDVCRAVLLDVPGASCSPLGYGLGGRSRARTPAPPGVQVAGGGALADDAHGAPSAVPPPVTVLAAGLFAAPAQHALQSSPLALLAATAQAGQHGGATYDVYQEHRVTGLAPGAPRGAGGSCLEREGAV